MGRAIVRTKARYGLRLILMAMRDRIIGPPSNCFRRRAQTRRR